MPKIYGDDKTNDEVIDFVNKYVNNVKLNKYDRFHNIMSLVPSGGNYILDYGCGWGHYSVAMRDKGNIVEAIDLFQNEIDICSLFWGKQENINFECKSINSFPNEIFDCVLSNQVIEHVHNVGNYLSGINRVLKPNGKLIISLPNIMNPRYFLAMLSNDMETRLIKHSTQMLEQYHKGHDHINAWDPRHFTTLMASMGFALERYIPTEGIAFPMSKPFKSYVYSTNTRFSNLSYTMTFLFIKVKTKNVQPEE